MASAPRANWFKHGTWNLAEQGVTRGADAATTVLLLWALPTELFSKLALAQAIVAPAFFFYVSPGLALYFGYARWKREGEAGFAARLRALRLYGWALGALSLVLAGAMALALRGESSTRLRFFALLWAFGLATGGNLCGADKEFLRLDLRFKALNFTTLYQKLTLLAGVGAAVAFCGARLEWLAAAMGFSMLSSAALVTALATRGTARPRGAPAFRTLREVATEFSLPTHLSGVVLNWVQTMDVFMLGVFRLPAISVGLYATALRVANLTLALPNALSNTFSIWLGRGEGASRAHERRNLARFSLGLMGVALAQAAVLLAAGPWLVGHFSHGRWSAAEQAQLLRWMAWILAGVVLLSGTLLAYSWSVLRGSARALLVRVQLPWLGFAAAAYAAAVHFGGPGLAAVANVPVAAAYLGLMGYLQKGIKKV